MDHDNQAADTVADYWTESPAQRVEIYAANLAARAQSHGRQVTIPGESADMNAPLVHAVRQATLLEVHMDLGYVVNDVRKAQEQQREDQGRETVAATKRAYEHGRAIGYEEGRTERVSEQSDAAVYLAHGNPSPNRAAEAVAIPRGYVAAWKHVHEEPDGTTFLREVYGTLDEDVRAGDTRAVIVAGPDKHLISLDRVRFAPKLETIVAERDLAQLETLHLLGRTEAVRLADDMDGNAKLDASVVLLKPEEAAPGSKPGRYIRVLAASDEEDEQRATVDLSLAQWLELVQAVETLWARSVLADGDGA